MSLFGRKKSEEEIVQERYDKSQALIQQGDTLVDKGDPEGGLRLYYEAARTFPSVGAWQIIFIQCAGMALNGDINRYDEARKAGRQVYEIDPNAGDGNHQFQGMIHFFEERYSDALKEIDLALERYPNSEAAWRIKGLSLQRLGRMEEANIAFSRADLYKQ